MELIYGLLAGATLGLVGGYILATHIHSIASAAADKVVNTLAASVGQTAVMTAAPAPAPVAVVAAKTGA